MQKYVGIVFDTLTKNKPSYATYCCAHCRTMKWITHLKKPNTNVQLYVRHADDIFEYVWGLYQHKKLSKIIC